MTNNNGNNKGGIGAIIFICLVIIFDVAYIVDYNIDRIAKEKQEEEEQRKRKEAAKKANARAWSKGETKGKDMSYLYFYADSTGALAIKGDTADVGSIYDFFQGVKNSYPQSNIILSKLDYNDIDSLLSQSEHGNKTLNFEITNSAYENSIKMMASQIPGGDPNQKTDSNSEKNKPKDGNGLPPLPDNDDGLSEPPPFNPPDK